MSDQLKELFYKTSFTLKGRIFHPNLLTTRTKTNQTTGKTREVFDVMFAWNPMDPANAAAMQHLIQFKDQMAAQLFPGVDTRALVNPIKASRIQGWPEYQRNDYKDNPAYLHGHHWINAESGKEFAPTVVNQQRQQVLIESEIYSGRNAVVNFQLYPMMVDPQNRQKKIGFGVNLNAVMLLEGGDKEGGRSEVDVNQVFGNFAQDMGMAPQFGQFGQQPQQQQAPAAGPQGQPAGYGHQAPLPPQQPWQQPQQAPVQQPPQLPPMPQQYPQQQPAPQWQQQPAPQAPAPGGFPGYGQAPQAPMAPAAPGAPLPGQFNPNGFGR